MTAPPTPGLLRVARVRVLLDPPVEIGTTPFGREREIPIVGGSVSGPGRDGEGLHGEVLRGGADRAWLNASVLVGSAIRDADAVSYDAYLLT